MAISTSAFLCMHSPYALSHSDPFTFVTLLLCHHAAQTVDSHPTDMTHIQHRHMSRAFRWVICMCTCERIYLHLYGYICAPCAFCANLLASIPCSCTATYVLAEMFTHACACPLHISTTWPIVRGSFSAFLGVSNIAHMFLLYVYIHIFINFMFFVASVFITNQSSIVFIDIVFFIFSKSTY